MKNQRVSTRSVEPLTLYRWTLLQSREGLGPRVLSCQLAEAIKRSPSQVRRDLMAIDYSGTPNGGYEVDRLLAALTTFLDAREVRAAALMGMGNLGRAIAAFLANRARKVRIAAAFDTDPRKVGLTIDGIRCYPVPQMAKILARERIGIGVIAVPAEQAQLAAEQLVAAGVTGILSFAPIVLRLPERVYIENIDLTLALQKAAFFVRKLPHAGTHNKHVEGIISC